MTQLDVLQLLGNSIGVAAVFGFVFGVLIIWLPKNVK
jgi:hypothetical protein